MRYRGSSSGTNAPCAAAAHGRRQSVERRRWRVQQQKQQQAASHANATEGIDGEGSSLFQLFAAGIDAAQHELSKHGALANRPPLSGLSGIDNAEEVLR